MKSISTLHSFLAFASKSYLAIMVLSICLKNTTVYSQQIDSAFQSETIIKINSKSSSLFTNKELTWIHKNGFESSGYDWEDKKINLNLSKAIDYRNLSRVVAVTGTLIAARGIAQYLFSGIAQEQERIDKSERQAEKIMLFSLGVFPIAAAINIGAHKKIKKANKIHLALNAK